MSAYRKFMSAQTVAMVASVAGGPPRFRRPKSAPTPATVATPATVSFARTPAALESRCPDLVPVDRWQEAVQDGRRFLARWDHQAHELGWTSRDLFGLQTSPEKPHPSYRRLSRYDETGLIWLLCGREVVALTEATAAIQNPTGAVTIYRRHNKPALGRRRRSRRLRVNPMTAHKQPS
jgi:hypothetical protein